MMMTKPVSNETTYSISVRTAFKTTETFTYSATDTIETLNQWIFERQGIPHDQQHIYATYYSTEEKITKDPDQLLSAFLPGATNLFIY